MIITAADSGERPDAAADGVSGEVKGEGKERNRRNLAQLQWRTAGGKRWRAAEGFWPLI